MPEYVDKIPENCTIEYDLVLGRAKEGDIPEFTKTLALIVEDPDAPAGTWDHLLLANIPVE